MTNHSRVGFLSLGLMGSPLAGLLTSKANCKVLIPGLSSRSKESQTRASQYGLKGTETLDQLFKVGEPQIDFFVSVLPPSEALKLAQQVAQLSREETATQDGKKLRPIYLDLNAISPSTSVQISEILIEKGWDYVCGSIVGMPPKEDGFRPAIYLSGDQTVVGRVRELGERATWKIQVLENSGIGASKALKLSYSMISKGIMQLSATSLLAASSYSSSTSAALASELSQSLPGFLPFLSRQMENVTPKSGRFVGEFEEMASYVDTGLGLASSSFSERENRTETNEGAAERFTPGNLFRSMAKMYGWFSRKQGKEERHRTLLEGQGMLKSELQNVESNKK